MPNLEIVEPHAASAEVRELNLDFRRGRGALGASGFQSAEQRLAAWHARTSFMIPPGKSQLLKDTA
jgi:hypothetical protein